MSDKDRQKKDGQRTDKKNQRMREDAGESPQGASTPTQARDQSNLSDEQPGPGEKPGRG